MYARVRGTDLRAAADLGKALVDEAPEMLKRVVLVTRRGIHVRDPVLVDLEIQDVSGPEALRDPRTFRQFRRREPAAAHPPCRAPQRRSPEHPSEHSATSNTSLPDPTTTGTARRSSSVICSSEVYPPTIKI
jgi:hypothetical protein